MRSNLKVVGNSGAKRVMCIQALKGKKGARLGDTIVASLKEAQPGVKVKKGQVVYGVVVQAAMQKGRCDGSEVKFDDNAVVLVNKQGEPTGTRVFGPVPHELRKKKACQDTQSCSAYCMRYKSFYACCLRPLSSQFTVHDTSEVVCNNLGDPDYKQDFQSRTNHELQDEQVALQKKVGKDMVRKSNRVRQLPINHYIGAFILLMAESTCLKDLATTVERLSENNTQRDAHETDHVNRLQNVETWDIECRWVSHSVNSAGVLTQGTPFNVRQVKLDFPRFGGSDPLNWLFRAEQFFSYFDLRDAQRLTIAFVHFEGFVVPWFQMLQKTHQVPNWVSLAKAIEDHFGPSQFSFGLKELLWREVLAQTPTSLLRAGSLARLFDKKNLMGFVSKTNSTLSGSSFKTTPVNSGLNSVFRTKFLSPSPLPPLLPKPQIKPLPHVIKLSPTEMQLCHEKGLCFTCDEKYTWNHKCINKQCLVLLTTGAELQEPFKVDDYLNENKEEELVVDHLLSLNAFHGSQGLTTIRFTGP
ncbi:ribosomal protein L14, bacterial [Tanacetum coccineum]